MIDRRSVTILHALSIGEALQECNRPPAHLFTLERHQPLARQPLFPIWTAHFILNFQKGPDFPPAPPALIAPNPSAFLVAEIAQDTEHRLKPVSPDSALALGLAVAAVCLASVRDWDLAACP